MFQAMLDRLVRLMNFVMVAFLAAMVVMVFGNVVLRYAFNSGITVSEELSRWLFVWMTFLGSLIALRTHHHLGSDTLVSRLPVLGKKICLALSHLLMLFLCAVMFRGSWQQTAINRSSTSAVMEVSMAYFYAAGLFFSAIAFLFVLSDFWKLVSGQLKDTELIGVVESEEDIPAQPAGAKS